MKKLTKPFIIALDGTASSGKSYTVNEIAKKMKLIAIDSGTILRATSLHFLNKGFTAKTIKLPNVCTFISKIKMDDMEKTLADPNLKVSGTSNMSKFLGGKRQVSLALKELMHKFVEQNANKTQGFIISGRNIQTEVFPDANVKIFLTASLKERGRRRYLELKSKGLKTTLKETTEQLRLRDLNDMTRKISPLKKAPDAFLLNNTNLNEIQTVKVAIAYIKSKI